jgi:glutamate dehydrogenase
MTDTHTGAQPSAGVVDTEVFARRYLAHAGSQLPGLELDSLDALAHDVLAFGMVRPAGQTLLRLHDLDDETTTIDVVSLDAAYIVESLIVDLERRHLPPRRVLHPQIVVVREPDGTMTRVYDLDDNADVPEGAMVESWIRVEVDRVPAEQQERLAAEIQRVLKDVLFAVADAPHMYGLIRQLADELTADPGEFDRETSEEAGELLLSHTTDH